MGAMYRIPPEHNKGCAQLPPRVIIGPSPLSSKCSSAGGDRLRVVQGQLLQTVVPFRGSRVVTQANPLKLLVCDWMSAKTSICDAWAEAHRCGVMCAACGEVLRDKAVPVVLVLGVHDHIRDVLAHVPVAGGA